MAVVLSRPHPLDTSPLLTIVHAASSLASTSFPVTATSHVKHTFKNKIDSNLSAANTTEPFRNEKSAHEEKKMTDTSIGLNTHILVVDDEEDLLELVRYNLVKDGYRVSCVATGRRLSHLFVGSHQICLFSICFFRASTDSKSVDD